MTKIPCLRVAFVLSAALAGVTVPLEAVAEISATASDPTVTYLAEVLILSFIAAALLVLDTTSWSLMTSRD
ncbi:MAG: hypothetical protein AB8B85_22385 [Paracoccaceae bacterium]